MLTLQFSTELMFIAIKPFSLEFFVMLLFKAMLHISLKGGLLLKLHARLSEWFTVNCRVEIGLLLIAGGGMGHSIATLLSMDVRL